jgi:formylglycine-generating enzyme required for sulfatase activity
MSRSKYLNQKPDDPAKPYVFISYARNDAPDDTGAAAQIEEALVTAGIHCFRDVHIPKADDWDLAIEDALEECNKMVLVGSSRSMDRTRIEVRDEWLPFYRKRKTVVLFAIEKFDLPRRFVRLNNINATIDREQALKDLLEAIQTGLSSTFEKLSNPALKAYRQSRIDEWSQPQYQLDKRFVNLTLSLASGEDGREFTKREKFLTQDLREILAETPKNPVLVLLGRPGSGKSTLLRHLEMDHCADQIRNNSDQVTFLISLNEYAPGQLPIDWLRERWAERVSGLGSLDDCLARHQMVFLFDAFNEIPHGSSDEYNNIAASWQRFARQMTWKKGHRIIFSCRNSDYGGRLSTKDLPVPQAEVQLMDNNQVRSFLAQYVPDHHQRVWEQIRDSRNFELYQTPYFLNLVCQVVDDSGNVPAGRAGLFTSYVRVLLERDLNGNLLRGSRLISDFDREMISSMEWADPFTLPDEGPLIRSFSQLAYAMQQKVSGSERALIRVTSQEVQKMIEDPALGDSIVKAGIDLNIIDRDKIKKPPIAFYHQLLQEYFAARSLAATPDPTLAHVEFEVRSVTPSLEERLATLPDYEPLPLIDQTGWEETILIAAPMAEDPNRFIRDLIPHNLPLAARCAASPEIDLDPRLKSELQKRLIERTQDRQVDLRARIAAGQALGLIGDPRFADHGDYLLPPMVTIAAGEYPIGDDQGMLDREKPAHTVNLAEFQIGVFPVTNAEYKRFIDAGGYQDERWWDTDEARAWRRGESSTDGQKQTYRVARGIFTQMDYDGKQELLGQIGATSDVVEDLIRLLDASDEEFELSLKGMFPDNETYDQPAQWQDINFNNPEQPVVGITWYEARAYCNWLTACAGPETGRIYRLPTEVEYEAAARGREGRAYSYGNEFESPRCNTFESHIRRTAPVGIFDNATPEGAFDLTGNVWSWTLSIFDQDRFPYPYRTDDGREDIHATGVMRPLRGGSWSDYRVNARAVFRNGLHPDYRVSVYGFRVVSVVRPPS